jgi:hypothetical protein
MFAAIQRGDRNLCMDMRGRADHHHINVRTLDCVTPVGAPIAPILIHDRGLGLRSMSNDLNQLVVSGILDDLSAAAHLQAGPNDGNVHRASPK